MNKKLSIITINYNDLEGLKRTVESVVNQTWQEFEYIIIDGGSTDGSAEYIESQKQYFDYWVSEPDKGIYNAMNKGIAKATGEYLLFLNSGDHLFSDTVLEKNHHYLEKFDLVYFNIEIANGKSSKIVSYPEKLSFSFFYSATICHQSTLIKKTLFETVGLYDENLKFVSDWKFFMLSLFRFNCSYMKIDTVFTTYYLDGISSDFENRQILNEERKYVLSCDFKGHIDDINQLLEFNKVVLNIRNSRKIKFLVKLGFLKKF